MLQVCDLKCEYLENPLGMDVLRPRFFWKLRTDTPSTLQTSYRIQISGDGGFTHILSDSGIVGTSSSVQIPCILDALSPKTRYFWRVAVTDNHGRHSGWSPTAFFETGLMSDSAWEACWIAAAPSPEAGPCPLFRKPFHVPSEVVSARLYITAAGLYEASVNGVRAGDLYFTPGFTNYRKYLQYQTYDVTGSLRKGLNVLGVTVGDGWYHGFLTWDKKRNVFGDDHALLALLDMALADGSTMTVVSDASWTTASGHILKSDIYMGEAQDARLAQVGWDTADFDASGWSPVRISRTPAGAVVAQNTTPVRKISEITPVSIFTTPAGDLVADMGQNMVGWVRFRASGNPGETIRLEHAEVLDREGNFYTENLRSAEQACSYTLAGTGEEVFEPTFTFQGFRYVRVSGASQPVVPASITGVVIHSDMAVTGDFECSEPLVNQLQRNILWGQKGNFLDVPTDCPQRDERLGWTGDAQMFIRTACFNMDVASFFTKWLRDLASEQTEDYGVPFVIPQVLRDTEASSSAWGDAAVICPWTIYQCYGDTRILEQQYDSMKGWVEYIRAQGPDPLLWNTGFHFGDWLGLDAREGSYVGATDRDFIATAFYACSTGLFAKTAEVLGRNEDAAVYGKLYQEILSAFRHEFIAPSGRLTVPTQTAHVLALMFDLMEEKDRPRVVRTLATLIRENKTHLTTGFVGTPYLCHVLSDNGEHALAMELLMQKDYPSWLYPVTQGATTIWEHWDGIRPDGTFWSKNMNSYNHYAYGAVGDWLYRCVAGLDNGGPGYRKLKFRPSPHSAMSYARATLETPFGISACGWKTEDRKLSISVTLPANTTGDLYLPDGILPATITCVSGDCSATPVSTGNQQVIGLGSGTYTFECLLAP